MTAVTAAVITVGGAGPAAAAPLAAAGASVVRPAAAAAYSPPPGFVYRPGYTSDNWLTCSLAGSGGVLTFQWEGYHCYQNDYGSWDLWVHPW